MNRKVLFDETVRRNQSDIARAIGVSKSTISRFKNGDAIPDDKLESLFRVLRISDEDILRYFGRRK